MSRPHSPRCTCATCFARKDKTHQLRALGTYRRFQSRHVDDTGVRTKIITTIGGLAEKCFTSATPDQIEQLLGIMSAAEAADREVAPQPAPAPAAPPVAPRPPPYMATRLAEVEAEAVSWLWGNHLPLGKLAVLDGDPDVGKSTLALDLVARVTTGRPMPSQELATMPASNVVLMAAEDGLGDTIRPRLDAAGADAGRVFHLDKVARVHDSGEVRYELASIPEDIGALDALVADHDAKLVIVDVLMAYLSGRADSYKDQDVRRNLEPLSDMARRRGACVLMLRHLRKSRGSALYAGGGAIGIVGVARAGMVAAADPEDDTGQRRILARSKGNLAPSWPSLAYQLVTDDEHGCARVEWLGEVDTKADDLMAFPSGRDDDADDATKVLTAILSEGPLWVKQVFDRMTEAGFSRDQAKRAKTKLKVRSEKFGAPGDADQGWKWVLPGHEERTEGGEEGGLQEPHPSPPSCSLRDLGSVPTEEEGMF